MIYTEAEIDKIVFAVKGTWVKHRNMRRKLVEESNNEVQSRIEAIKKDIRLRKLNGAKEQDVRGLYADITELELKMLQPAR